MSTTHDRNGIPRLSPERYNGWVTELTAQKRMTTGEKKRRAKQERIRRFLDRSEEFRREREAQRQGTTP